MVQKTVERVGQIDTLVLNAGVIPMKTVSTTTEEDFDAIFALNVKGPYSLVQKALPHMQAGGRVIFVSTSVIHASQLSPPYSPCAATKGAIEQMTHAFAKDLGSRGITVNAVAPGPTATELFLKGKSEELIGKIARFSPFGKLGEPAEVADVFVLWAGEASRWVSGTGDSGQWSVGLLVVLLPVSSQAPVECLPSHSIRAKVPGAMGTTVVYTSLSTAIKACIARAHCNRSFVHRNKAIESVAVDFPRHASLNPCDATFGLPSAQRQQRSEPRVKPPLRSAHINWLDQYTPASTALTSSPRSCRSPTRCFRQ